MGGIGSSRNKKLGAMLRAAFMRLEVYSSYRVTGSDSFGDILSIV